MTTRLHRLFALVCTVLFLGVAHVAQAQSVTIQWDANPEPEVTGYAVSYGTRSGLYDKRIDVGNTTSYTLTLSPAVATTYFFSVTAYSPWGQSDPAPEVSTTVRASQASNPLLIVDGPTPWQAVPSDIFLTGWAADLGSQASSGIDAIHVYAYPNPGSGAPPVFMGVAAYGTTRGDVAAAFGSQFVNSGYSLPIVGLSPGRYDLAVFAHSTITNAFGKPTVVPITVFAASAPVAQVGTQLYIDTPRTGQAIDGALFVAGWAADPRSTSGTGVDRVDVWAYPGPGSGTLPFYLGNALYGKDRPDVGAIFGSRFRNTGYAINVMNLPGGLYDIVAFARSTVTGAAENPRIVRVTLKPAVMVNIDTPTIGATVSGGFQLSGWAIDRRATADSGIDTLHIWMYPNPGSGAPPVFLGTSATGVARPDVGAAFGANFSFAGYNAVVPALVPGVYDIVVFGHSSATGTFENASVVRVTVR
jgi:hypothetical protein